MIITEDDLERALAEERHHLFTAIGKALYELEHRVSLLIDVGIKERYPTGNKLKGVGKIKVKELLERLWIIADESNNKELVEITKELESFVEETSNDIKEFNSKLGTLMKKVEALEVKKGGNDRVEKLKKD